MKKIFILALIAVIGFGVIGKVLLKNTSKQPVESSQNERYMDIETFVSTNISSLSPTKESVGGKFYITKIETKDGSGIVEYEDGHNAYIADFTYSINEDGKPLVNSFKIR